MPDLLSAKRRCFPRSAPVDLARRTRYNPKTLCNQRFRLKSRASGVFVHLEVALVFKTSGGFEQSSLWVRFPYTPVSLDDAANSYDKSQVA